MIKVYGMDPEFLGLIIEARGPHGPIYDENGKIDLANLQKQY
jgi:hypothetical protein